jgi:hypothetical protein
MAQAVFAGEEVKELALEECATILAHLHAEIARFLKNLFMSDGPGDASNRNGEHK